MGLGVRLSEDYPLNSRVTYNLFNIIFQLTCYITITLYTLINVKYEFFILLGFLIWFKLILTGERNKREGYGYAKSIPHCWRS